MATTKWTREETDLLLEMHFNGRSMTFIANHLNKSRDAIMSRLWKLTSGYGSCASYAPVSPRSERGSRLNAREIKAIETALYGDGQVLNDRRLAKCTPEFIARIINCPIKLVLDYQEGKKGGTFDI